MNRAPLWRALLALLVVSVTGFFAFTQDPRLGLDLRGGTQIVLETQDSPTTEANAESTGRAVSVLERRVNALGVAEASATVQAAELLGEELQASIAESDLADLRSMAARNDLELDEVVLGEEPQV